MPDQAPRQRLVSLWHDLNANNIDVIFMIVFFSVHAAACSKAK